MARKRTTSFRTYAPGSCRRGLGSRFWGTAAFATSEEHDQRAPEANDHRGRTHEDRGKESDHTEHLEHGMQRPYACRSAGSDLEKAVQYHEDSKAQPRSVKQVFELPRSPPRVHEGEDEGGCRHEGQHVGGSVAVKPDRNAGVDAPAFGTGKITR